MAKIRMQASPKYTTDYSYTIYIVLRHILLFFIDKGIISIKLTKLSIKWHLIGTNCIQSFYEPEVTATYHCRATCPLHFFFSENERILSFSIVVLCHCVAPLMCILFSFSFISTFFPLYINTLYLGALPSYGSYIGQNLYIVLLLGGMYVGCDSILKSLNITGRESASVPIVNNRVQFYMIFIEGLLIISSISLYVNFYLLAQTNIYIYALFFVSKVILFGIMFILTGVTISDNLAGLVMVEGSRKLVVMVILWFIIVNGIFLVSKAYIAPSSTADVLYNTLNHNLVRNY
ncbi:hypothetical protein NEAUS07_2625 [Nematocida ausubeli]|nr:hypothetical protein NEAUS07_2625 [Nematocida ausubeli]